MRLTVYLRSTLSILVLLFSMGIGRMPSKSAAIPLAKKISLFEFGHSIIKRVVREAKVPFCSDLEKLSLQLTRPSDEEIAPDAVEHITSILNADFNDPQLLIGMLVKLSRKFAEANVYTKIKALLTLHLLMQDAHPKAQVALSKALTSLRQEMDDKVGALYFARDSIEEAGSAVESVGDMEAVQLTRVYSGYVFDFLELRSDSQASKSSKKASKQRTIHPDSDVNRAEALQSLLVTGEAVEEAGEQVAASLGKQCLSSIRKDRAWAVKELRQLLESGVIADEDSRESAKAVLRKFEVRRSRDAQMPTKSASSISTPTTPKKGTPVKAKSSGKGRGPTLKKL